MVLVALACGGCRLTLAVDVDVSRDGGGVLAVSVAADAELLQIAEESGADPLADLADAAADLGGGWRVRERSGEDGSRSVVLTTGFDDPEDFETVTEELAGALAADEVDLLDGMTLTLTDDRVRLAGAAGAEPTRVVREYGLTPRRAVRLLNRNEAFDYRVSATLPGEVVEAGGGRASERTVAWTVAPGERVEFTAESTRPGPPWLRGVLGAAAGGLLAAALLWMIARRRRRGRDGDRAAPGD